VWIRPSTRRLCVEFMPHEPGFLLLAFMDSPSRLLSDASLLDPPGEAEIIASISLRDYHSICYSHLRKRHYFPNPAGIAVNLGSIRQFLGPAHERSVGIAFAPDPTYWLWEPGWRAKHPLIEGHWNAYVICRVQRSTAAILGH
jgi:hypothetical protein